MALIAGIVLLLIELSVMIARLGCWFIFMAVGALTQCQAVSCNLLPCTSETIALQRRLCRELLCQPPAKLRFSTSACTLALCSELGRLPTCSVSLDSVLPSALCTPAPSNPREHLRPQEFAEKMKSVLRLELPLIPRSIVMLMPS